MRPSQSISFDRVAHLYDETRTLPPEQMKAILEVFHRELTGYGRVLEVGVGTGRFAAPLQAMGVQVLGVDISSQMVTRGLEKGLRGTFLADALQLPFLDKSLDAVYSIHVLHLVADWKRALREIARVARHAYYTVATYWDEIRTPYDAYWDRLREEGIERPIPGIHERKLPEVLTPERRTTVGTFEERHSASEWIERLDNRIFSGQWELPQEVHARAIDAVRREFGDRLFTYLKRVEVIRWDAEDLIQV